MKYPLILLAMLVSWQPLVAESKSAPKPLAAGARVQTLTVHEWGTFTVLQDETGKALPGVNINEESLPHFVRRLAYDLVADSNQLGPYVGVRSKGIVRNYPPVVMRMETPVIYFHTPADWDAARKVDVSVDFRGGWISEWYPDAKVVAPGFNNNGRSIGHITPDTVGRIEWKNLTIGATGRFPKTEDAVWLAPRNVRSARVSNDKGQTEQYLFYRGVATIAAPLRVVRTDNGRVLQIHGDGSSDRIKAIWLVDIRADQTCAFRSIEGTPSTTGPMASTAATFDSTDYSPGNLVKLRSSMRVALIGAGLFEDEARAMLETWKISYFQSPGLRLFFVLPRRWVDQVLPLTVSEPANTERVMVGRIELISPRQRARVRQLAQTKRVSKLDWLQAALDRLPNDQRQRAWRDLYQGTRTFEQVGIKPPSDYQIFLDLGRFREALVLDAQRRAPTAALGQFIKVYRLGPPRGGP